MSELIEAVPIGSLRIVEVEGGFGGPGWTWRYRVERMMPGGRFLMWSWGPRWETVSDNLTDADAKAFIARDGRYERVVSVHQPPTDRKEA